MPAPAFRHGRRFGAALAGILYSAITAASGCRAESPPVPGAEFLLSAGDSTFWVQGQRAGYRVRGSPILLASFDGRFHEIYVTDEDRSYTTGVFVGQRIWRRDLVTGDSLLVFEDSLVVAYADSFAASNPDAARLLPEEELVEDPAASVTAEVSIIELHGPYLSYEHHVDYEFYGRDSWHATRRGVVDLRSGRRVAISDVLGAAESRRVIRSGRHSFINAIDSVTSATSAAGRRAAAAIADFSFDELSFVISPRDGGFAVAFAAPGRGEGASGATTLQLDPVAAPDPEWWDEVRRSLPASADARSDRWKGPGYDVVARYDTGVAELSITGARREAKIGSFPTPVAAVHWLDQPPVDGRMRDALVRAFDEAAHYDESIRTASRWRGMSRLARQSAGSRSGSAVRQVTDHRVPRTNCNETGEDGKGIAARDFRADDAAGREQLRPCLRRGHPLDDGQGRSDRRLQAFAHERRDGVDRPRRLSRADPHG